jgi:hypothetical protein
VNRRAGETQADLRPEIHRTYSRPSKRQRTDPLQAAVWLTQTKRPQGADLSKLSIFVGSSGAGGETESSSSSSSIPTIPIHTEELCLSLHPTRQEITTPNPQSAAAVFHPRQPPKQPKSGAGSGETTQNPPTGNPHQGRADEDRYDLYSTPEPSLTVPFTTAPGPASARPGKRSASALHPLEPIPARDQGRDPESPIWRQQFLALGNP